MRPPRTPKVLCHPDDANMLAAYGRSERGYWIEVSRDGALVACGTFPSEGRAHLVPPRSLLLFVWTLGFFQRRQRRAARGYLAK
jgi:hypothetical protein